MALGDFTPDPTRSAYGLWAFGWIDTGQPYPHGVQATMRRAGGGAFTPKADYDFTSGVLPAGMTFSRASTATYTKSDGIISNRAIDTPRFDFDPVTLKPAGLLLENPATNLLTGALIGGGGLLTQGVTVTAVAHTLSFYGPGTVTLSGAHAAVVVGAGDYPARKTYTFTPTAGALAVQVTGTVQYPNIEPGSFATSFIPTAGAPVTRATDICNVSGANFTALGIGAVGTVVAEWDIPGMVAAGADNIWNMTSGANLAIESRLGVAIAGSDGRVTNTVSQADTLSFAVKQPYLVNRCALAYGPNYVQYAGNGVVVGPPDLVATMPVINALNFAGAGFSTKRLRRWQYYPYIMNDSLLAAITSL